MSDAPTADAAPVPAADSVEAARLPAEGVGASGEVADEARRLDNPGPDAALIQARGLTKRFGDFIAVDAIDFDVAQGESFGFLGPNGAGKTSTMRMIGCVSPLSDGDARRPRLRPAPRRAAIRARIGVVPQQDTLDTELTVRENLLIYGRYFGLSREECARRADELLEFVQLTERANDTVEPLSGGMKRRLTIARALINEPDLLLLDEPTTGLDPQARHLLWDRLYRLKQRGRDARPDDALHGRGRAAVRPPRRHGQGQDRGRGLAARADRAATRPARSPSCASRPASRRRSTASSTGSPSASSACPIASCSTPTTARPPSRPSTSAVSARRPSWSAARPSRTSSCG